MIQRDADPTALAEQVRPSSVRSLGALEVPTGPTDEEQEELLDYTPAPPRNTQMLLVRFQLAQSRACRWLRLRGKLMP
jgi:hypothetical protein